MNGLVFNMVGGGGGGVKLVSIAITTPPAKRPTSPVKPSARQG